MQKRSTELKLIDENGVCCKTSMRSFSKDNNRNSTKNHKNETKDVNGGQEQGDTNKNDLLTSPQPSRSSTPDSQITVRSSPLSNKVDTISVCRSCVKKCHSRLSSSSSNSLLVQSSGSGKPSHSCSHNKTDDRKASLNSNESYTVSSASSTITGEIKTDSSHNQENSKLISSPSNSNKSSTVDINSNKNPDYRIKSTTPCPCKCTPKDFERTIIEPDTCIHETVKIFESLIDAKKKIVSKAPSMSQIVLNKLNESKKNEETKTAEPDEDWSLMLIGLAQLNPAASLVTSLDPFEVVPTISVVPPTPEGNSGSRLRYEIVCLVEKFISNS